MSIYSRSTSFYSILVYDSQQVTNKIKIVVYTLTTANEYDNK